jgi:hypothetical protein
MTARLTKRAAQRWVPKRPRKPSSQRLGPRRLTASLTRGKGELVWLDYLPPGWEIAEARWHLLVDEFVRGTLRHEPDASGRCRCSCGCQP